MIFDKKKLQIGCTVHYKDNKGNSQTGTIASEIVTYRGDEAVCLIGIKNPMPVKYLYTEPFKDKGTPMYFSAPKTVSNTVFELDVKEKGIKVVLHQNPTDIKGAIRLNQRIAKSDKFITILPL